MAFGDFSYLFPEKNKVVAADTQGTDKGPDAPVMDEVKDDSVSTGAFPPQMPSAPPSPTKRYPAGTSVRDIFSGEIGTVAKQPKGQFKDIIFVTFGQETHPIRIDQLEAVAPLAAPLMPEIANPTEAHPAAGAAMGDIQPGETESLRPEEVAASKVEADMGEDLPERQYTEHFDEVEFEGQKYDADHVPAEPEVGIPGHVWVFNRGDEDLYLAEDGNVYDGQSGKIMGPGVLYTNGKAVDLSASKKVKAELEMWERASNYAGDDFTGYYVGLSKHRDSEVLERANFDAMLKALGGEHSSPEWEKAHPEEVAEGHEEVMAAHSGHFAVGWVETILVHKDSPKVSELKALMDKYEDYPVVDEGLFSQYETEEQNEAWTAEMNKVLSLVRESSPELAEVTWETMDPKLADLLEQTAYEKMSNSGEAYFEPEELVPEVMEEWQNTKGTREQEELEKAGQEQLPGFERKAALKKALALKAAKMKRKKAKGLSGYGKVKASVGKRWYVGHGKDKQEAFQYEGEPTETTHPQYGAVTGPFKTRRGAEYAAGYRGPIYQHVNEFEEAAKSGQGQEHGTYAALLEKVKALEKKDHASVLSLIGYVPKGWDGMVAQLEKDGIKLESPKAEYDVRAMFEKGLNTQEVGYALACQGVPVVAIKAAISAAGETPSEPAPTTDPGAGNEWAWDKDKKWYIRKIMTAAQEIVAEQKVEAKTPPNISEGLMHRLKKQYPGDLEKAYATAWSISKKMGKGKKAKLKGAQAPEVGKRYVEYEAEDGIPFEVLKLGTAEELGVEYPEAYEESKLGMSADQWADWAKTPAALVQYEGDNRPSIYSQAYIKDLHPYAG